jgi:hypothetical protein
MYKTPTKTPDTPTFEGKPVEWKEVNTGRMQGV